MGYVARSVAAQDVINALWQGSNYYISCIETDNTGNYATYFKKTIDFSNIDYLFIGWDDNGAFLKCSIGGVQKFEEGGAATQNFETIDCTGITGENILLLEAKDGGVGIRFLTDLSMWTRDS